MDRVHGAHNAPVFLTPPVTLGVLADTHIPDRYTHLPEEVLQVFRQAGVAAILHAGDVTHPRVLRTLAQVAPVYAVRGNRDFLLWWSLPPQVEFRIGPWTLTLTHGHGGLWRYAWDKAAFLVGRPLTFREIEDRAWRQHPRAQVVVLGHTHAPVLRRTANRWIFNPGSPTVPPAYHPNIPRCVGLIHVSQHHHLRFQWILL